MQRKRRPTRRTGADARSERDPVDGVYHRIDPGTSQHLANGAVAVAGSDEPNDGSMWALGRAGSEIHVIVRLPVDSPPTTRRSASLIP